MVTLSAIAVLGDTSIYPLIVLVPVFVIVEPASTPKFCADPKYEIVNAYTDIHTSGNAKASAQFIFFSS